MKKYTNWITIPDDNASRAHGSVKQADPSLKKSDLKNKIFFGAAFVVMTIVVFALTAPNTFNSLLKGSLFDTSGISESDMKVSILPKKDSTSTSTSSTSSSGGASSTSSTSSSGSSGSVATT